jgi:hypothetical protein
MSKMMSEYERGWRLEGSLFSRRAKQAGGNHMVIIMYINIFGSFD